MRFGPFTIDVRTGELFREGRRIPIQRQPFEVLVALLERPGEVVTRSELRTRLWGTTTFVDFERGLNTAVRRLRRALGDDRKNPRYVETVPGQGYRFVIAAAEPASRTHVPYAGVPHLPWTPLLGWDLWAER
jgi:DNA-binding winged helix-turn-helix (wHTH) protein